MGVKHDAIRKVTDRPFEREIERRLLGIERMTPQGIGGKKPVAARVPVGRIADIAGMIEDGDGRERGWCRPGQRAPAAALTTRLRPSRLRWSGIRAPRRKCSPRRSLWSATPLASVKVPPFSSGDIRASARHAQAQQPILVVVETPPSAVKLTCSVDRARCAWWANT